MERRDVEFTSGHDACAAWLYLPDGDPPYACVVMAHGWTGVREQRLDAFAERFVGEGMAALVFDYRHFGASGGQPRQLLDVGRQLEDWRAAIRFARGLAEIDAARVALWGTSFSGGHVMAIAAEDHVVAAVVANVPFADGLRNLPRLGAGLALRLTARGLRDRLAAALGQPPVMVPSVGPPGSLAVMTSPDAEPGFRAIDPPGSSWRNEAPARIALHVGRYRPGRHAGRIRCPLFVAIASDDVVTPPEFAVAAAERAPAAEVHSYPGGHFDLYRGEAFETVAADQAAFLRSHLLR